MLFLSFFRSFTLMDEGKFRYPTFIKRGSSNVALSSVETMLVQMVAKYSSVTSSPSTLIGQGSITVWLTFCLTGLDSNALLMFNQQQINLFSQIQTSQTGGQLYSDTSPYKVSECSLDWLNQRDGKCRVSIQPFLPFSKPNTNTAGSSKA